MFYKIVNPDEWYKIDRSCIIGTQSHWNELREKILKRDKHTCIYCGTTKGPFEVDHIMPKSRGGLDVESNLVCACRRCNRSKKDRTPEEWGWPNNIDIIRR